jgi:hypothetical protein
MPPSTRTLLLERAAERVEARLLELDRVMEAGGDEPAIWREYLALAQALAVLAPAIKPEATGRLLSNAEMAARLGIAERTLRRRRKAGALVPAVELGRRGRGVTVRWRGLEAGG